MKPFIFYSILAICIVKSATFSSAASLNVLFIASDDMRPQLGCYGDATVKSPHLDALAKRGMVFQRSYVQQALCSPSRISMLSGRYPATTGIFEIGRPLRATMPDITTLPQHFKNHGYHTRSLGKIYHVGIDDDASWTVPAWHSKMPRYGPIGRAAIEAKRKDDEAKGVKRQGRTKGAGNYAGPAFEIVDCGDEELLDGDTATAAIAQLREHAQNPARSFFLAVGFANPHVPWVAPRKYWELYDRAKLPLATNEFLPQGAPAFATAPAQDFPSYANVPDGEMPEAFKRTCLHGYLAAISYIDAQVGRLLAALDETGLAKNTVVVFWTDHGYYMGEHTWWGMKHNNYEGATRNCLIIAQPETKHAGAKTTALAQSVDLAPTLTELCGLPAHPGFQGRSLKPVLANPAATVNDAAFSWYPKEGWLGVAMRTDQWRFVEWTKPGQRPICELYNMARDSQNDENIAGKPDHAKLVDSLSLRLRDRFPVQEFQPPPAGKKR
ncbi:MAG: sulfatase [Planctomycetaceae bacterium]|nr:sulfatase [Planctomycetaceae bacterium]